MNFKGILRKTAAGGIASGVIIAVLIIIITPAAEQLRDFISNLWKHEPINIVITQAVDGNNNNVSSNGVTPSPTITFRFEPTNRDKINDRLNLECSLDGQSPFICTRTASYSSLSKAPHVFQVKVNDQSVKISNPTTFSFTVVPSITVRGVILMNNSGVQNVEIIMDDNNRQRTDDIGQFAFPFVLTREDIAHTFTISIVDEKGQKLQCENKKLRLSPIGEVADLTFKVENYRCSNVVPVTASNKSDVFKPESTLGYGAVDLLYNYTLVRQPTTPNSKDGLWDVSIYLDGPDLSNVSKVKYYLHPTFAPNNVVEVTSQNNPNFSLDISAYGGFKLYAKVYCNCLKPVTELNSTRYVYSSDTVLDFTRFLHLRY